MNNTAKALSIMILAFGSNVPTFAACGKSRVQRRAVINWCGDCNRDEFKNSMKASEQYLSRGAAKVFSFQGPAPQDQKDVMATRKNLAKAIQQIKDDKNQWQKENPSADPSSYEVVFFVSNHGTQFIDNDNKKIDAYGITGDPNGDTLDQKDLNVIGQIFGEAGVRLKAVFGQCFGGTMRDDLYKGYTAGGGQCGCITALSAPKKSSTGLGVGDKAWEQQIATLSGTENISLLQAGWRALDGKLLGSDGGGAVNEGFSQSEALMFDYFLKSPEGKVLSNAANYGELESASAKLKDKASRSSRPMSLYSGILEQTRKERQSALANLLKTSVQDPTLESKIKSAKDSRIGAFEHYAAVDRERDQISKSIEELSKKVESLKDSLGDELNSAYKKLFAAYDADKAWHERGDQKYQKSSIPLAGSLSSRADLEEAFIKLAPIELVNQFASLRKCELEQIGPGNESKSNTPPAADIPSQHQGQ